LDLIRIANDDALTNRRSWVLKPFAEDGSLDMLCAEKDSIHIQHLIRAPMECVRAVAILAGIVTLHVDPLWFPPRDLCIAPILRKHDGFVTDPVLFAKIIHISPDIAELIWIRVGDTNFSALLPFDFFGLPETS